MPLYVNLRRVYNELAEAGVGPGQAFAPEQLFPFDQIHYHGTDAVRQAAATLGLRRDSRVLEIGSGLGGPARYLAHTVGCHVTALDVQDEMHTLAVDLTARCGLADRVTHVLGDALTCPLPDAGFDAVVSWLAVHQIPRRPLLFERLHRTLAPGGALYIEDLHARAPFAGADADDVRDLLIGVTMTSADEYQRELHAAGFSDVQLIDMTDDWAEFCAGRAAAWRQARDRHVRVHGVDTYERLQGFFSGVQRLFEHGSLGGIRIVAR
jgi:cyclopropane fatty-acyl-phospholipid synthase-like methyltransferase